MKNRLDIVHNYCIKKERMTNMLMVYRLPNTDRIPQGFINKR